jgi:redox-sensitive bicupin YhaK (pirin superfamily)
MSGPVTLDDTPATAAGERATDEPCVEMVEGRETQVGTVRVKRVLPRRPRRTVGPWCFADLMGPVAVTEQEGVDIGPHPHMGLQTVTWLVAGELVHRDSLGSEQPIRAGQLNLMTAGQGVAHAEENSGRYRGDLLGIQLWVAQPEATRNDAAAFEHHVELPVVALARAGTATVLLGEFAGAASPARRDSDHSGVELDLRGPGATLPLRPDYEYALVALEGAVAIGGQRLAPGVLGYLGTGRDECQLEADEPARALLLGGLPFTEPLLMWWNFVARTEEEVSVARREWAAGSDRFGSVSSSSRRIEASVPPWERGA